jgi:hypothetical protein
MASSGCHSGVLVGRPHITDRLGLFKDVATNSPSTSAELAARTGTQERDVREWLGAMANAGYLEYEPSSGQYTLPPEHALIDRDDYAGCERFATNHYSTPG